MRVRSISWLALGSALGLLFSVASFAQVQRGEERKGSQAQSGTAGEPKAGQDTVKVSRIIGYTVKNQKGEELGKIEELVINDKDGRIAYAVLSYGGFLGIGDKLFAIPWDALTPDFTHETFVLKVDREQLQAAQGFDKDHWPSSADPRWGGKETGARPNLEESQSQSPSSAQTGRSESGRVQESVTLPLKLEKGKTYTYDVTPPSFRVSESSSRGQSQERYQYKLQVEDVSPAGDATVLLTFNPAMFGQAGGEREKKATVSVGADGMVKSVQPMEEQRSSTGGSSGSSGATGATGGTGSTGSTAEGGRGSTDQPSSSWAFLTDLKSHLQFLFASGLHNQSLEVGKVYSFGSLGGGYGSFQSRSSSKYGSQSQSSSSQSGRYEQSARSGLEQAVGSLQLKFEGKASEHGQDVAKFTLVPMPGLNPTTPSTGSSTGSSSSSQGLGQVSFRVKDGLLERFMFERELPPAFASFQGLTLERSGS
jgi:sporulation protein YlmC with PRC-barrel domain